MRVLFMILCGALASGCLRQRFDLCSQTPPHPQCLIDAGPADAAIDANSDATSDAFTPDAFTPDSFTPEADAFTPETDAFTPETDAFTPPDAITPQPDAFVADAFVPPAFSEDAP